MFEEYLENIVEILKNKMSGGNSTHPLAHFNLMTYLVQLCLEEHRIHIHMS